MFEERNKEVRTAFEVRSGHRSDQIYAKSMYMQIHNEKSTMTKEMSRISQTSSSKGSV